MAGRAGRALLVAAALCTGATCYAPARAAAPISATADAPDEIERIVKGLESGDSIAKGLESGDSNATLSKLDHYLSKPHNAFDRARAHVIRGLVLLALKREADAVTAYAEAGKAMPDNPAIPKLQFEQGLWAESTPVARAALERLIAAFPDVARKLPNQQVFWFIRAYRDRKQQAEADALTVELAGIGFGDGESRQWLALSAARLLVAQGKVDEATALLGPVVSRDVLETALVQKRFAVLWPRLEAQAGPHMERAETAAVLTAQRELAEQPGDILRRAGLVHALHEARRFGEADRVAKDVAATSEAMRALDEPGGWLVNEHALVLHDAGRAAEADARFAAMREINIQEKSWLISMIINRAELLVQDGKFGQAEPLLAEAGTLAEKHGSAYASQLIRRLKVCTSKGLSQDAKLPALIAEMAAHQDDAAGATVEGLVCVGRWDDAEKLVIAGLADPEKAEDFVKSLQREPLGSGDPSRWTKGWAELRARPAVGTAFDQVGRDLPATLRPVPSPGAR